MKLKTKDVAICGLFIAFIAIGAFLKISIPLPVYDMSFTLQWLFVVCSALLLEQKQAVTVVGLYLVMGLAGIPIFAHGGGIGYVLRPGFGFLLGFFVAVIIISCMIKSFSRERFFGYLFSSFVGMIAYYAIGAVYFYIMTNLYLKTSVDFKTVVITYCLVTVLPDFALCVIASALSLRLKPILKKIGKN